VKAISYSSILALFCAACLNQDQFQTIINMLNRMDEKLETVARKVNFLTSKLTAAASGELPHLPEGLDLPADAVRNIKKASELVLRDPRTRTNLVGHFCVSVYFVFYMHT